MSAAKMTDLPRAAVARVVKSNSAVRADAGLARKLRCLAVVILITTATCFAPVAAGSVEIRGVANITTNTTFQSAFRNAVDIATHSDRDIIVTFTPESVVVTTPDKHIPAIERLARAAAVGLGVGVVLGCTAAGVTIYFAAPVASTVVVAEFTGLVATTTVLAVGAEATAIAKENGWM